MKRIVDNGKLPPKTAETQSAISPDALKKFYANKFTLNQFLFQQQLEFVADPSPFKVAVCSRRAGKTVACAAHLINTAIYNPDTVSLYITLSRNNAKKLIWKEALKINKTFNLGGVADSTELSLSFPNDSIIYFSGAKDQSEIEKFRGLPIKLCYIDECQSFKSYIKDLIDDIIAPALMDYAGNLCLIGTPGPIPTGYFHECAVVSEAWKKYHWTFWQNPYIALKSGKTHQEIFERELKRRGVTAEDPSIQREWFGKWILDSNSLLIHYDAKKNHFIDRLPNTKYHYIMGIDVGYVDSDALCILAYSDKEPTTYLVEELVTPKQGITELVDQINLLDEKYKVSKMVMDMGGLGKKIGEELIRRHGIPVEAADKTRKMENIEFLNDALRTDRFKAKSNSRFAQDSYLVEIDRNKSTPDKIKVSDRFHSDIIDAVLYAFKCSPAYAYTSPVQKPKPGSKEWADAEHDKMFEAEKEGLMREMEYDKWLNGEE